MSSEAAGAKLTTPLCGDAEGGGWEAVAPPTAAPLPLLMRIWLVVGGCPGEPRAPAARVLARIWSTTVTTTLVAYSLIMAMGAVFMTAQAAECWEVAYFFMSLFWLANSALLVLLVREFRCILGRWRVAGRLLCPPSGTRLGDRAAAAAIDALPQARSTTSPPSHRLLISVLALFFAVGVANISVYSVSMGSISQTGACSSYKHSHSSAAHSWTSFFVVIGFYVYLVPAGLSWALIPLIRSVIEGTDHRLTAPVAELQRTPPRATQDPKANDGAEAVWDAYRGAVAQADALSAQLAPLWLRGFAALAVMIVGNLLSFWTYAFSRGLGSDRAFLLLVTAFSSLASFIGVALLLHQPALVHSRATTALERALATDGALSLPNRAALHSVLARRPVAFTVWGVPITQTLLTRMLTAMVASFLPPAFKALVGANNTPH